jgi:hypothetical protein
MALCVGFNVAALMAEDRCGRDDQCELGVHAAGQLAEWPAETPTSAPA